MLLLLVIIIIINIFYSFIYLFKLQWCSIIILVNTMKVQIKAIIIIMPLTLIHS